MQAKTILVGVLLLVLFGVGSVEAFAQIEVLGVKIDLPNPFYLIGSINIITLFGFALTINFIILILAIIVLLIGVFGK